MTWDSLIWGQHELLLNKVNGFCHSAFIAQTLLWFCILLERLMDAIFCTSICSSSVLDVYTLSEFKLFPDV